MSKSFAQLYNQCDGITNEQNIGGNTKEEVGGLFHDIVEKVEDIDKSEANRQEAFENSQQERNEEFQQTMEQYGELPSKVSELSSQVDAVEEKMPATEEDGFYITDKDGNIIACINANGEIDATKVSEHFVEILKSKGVGGSDEIKQTEDDGFYITDRYGRVVLKYDTNGFDVAKVSSNLKENLMHAKSCISDPLQETAAENPCVVIDTNSYNAGTMYVSYISSPKDVGESFDACKLAVTSLQNFNVVEHYEVVSRNANDNKGSNTDIVNAIIMQVADNRVRVFYRIGSTGSASSNRQMYYKDFNTTTKTFGEQTKVMFKADPSSNAVDLSSSNFRICYEADGMSSHLGGTEYPTMTGNVIKKDGVWYTTINNEGYAMLVKSSDNGATWEKVSYIPQYSQYESSLCLLDGIFYVLLRNGAPYRGSSGAAYTNNNLWYSADDGATWQSSGIEVEMGNSRPYMIEMLGKLYIAVNDNNQKGGWSIARPWRCMVSIYEVDLSAKRLIRKKHYKDRYGLVELCLTRYNDRLFLFYSNGGLFPKGEAAFSGYAQGKDTMYVSEIDNDFNLITNPQI